MKIMTTLLLSCLFLAASAIVAEPPKVEFFLTRYDSKDCLNRAVKALGAAGFTLKKGTYQGEDRVGIQGEYTGAVGCSTEVPNAVVFVVSGPNYQQVKYMAQSIQSAFMNR